MRIPITNSTDKDSISVSPDLRFDERLSGVPQAPLCAMNGIPIESTMVSTIYFQTYEKSQLDIWLAKKRIDPQSGAPLPEAIYAHDEKGEPLLNSQGKPLVIKTMGPNPAVEELRSELNNIVDQLFRTGIVSVADFHKAIRTGEIKGITYGERHLVLEDLETGTTALHVACEYGRAAVVENFLKNGTFKILNARDKKQRTPLHIACLIGHINCIEILLKTEFEITEIKNIAVDKRADEKRALENKESEIEQVTTIKIIKVDIHAQDQDGNTALHFAAMGGNIEILTLLIKVGLDPNMANKQGDTVLHLAARTNKSEAIKFLITQIKEENIDAFNVAGKTALHVAAESGSLESLIGLFSGGAEYLDVHLEREQRVGSGMGLDYFETVLTLACRGNHLPIVKYLTKENPIGMCARDKRNAFLVASKLGHIDALRCLLENGISTNYFRKNYYLYLFHQLCKIGTSQAVELCLPLAETINEAHNCHTPLFDALNSYFREERSTKDTFEIVKTLIAKGADYKAHDFLSEMSILHAAARFSEGDQLIPYVISLLGPKSVNAADSRGKTPLHYAADRGSICAVKQLLEAKADYNAVCQYGDTAFHLAAKSHELSVMESLVEAKCDTHAINKKKQNPLHMACENDRYIKLGDSAQVKFNRVKKENAIHFLLKLKGAEMDVKAIDSDSNLPLHYMAVCKSKWNDAPLAEIMLKIAGINIAFHKNNEGETPLVKAARAGNEMLFLLLFNLRSQKTYLPEQLASAFYSACEGDNSHLEEGHNNIVRHFLALYRKEFTMVPSRLPFLLLNACEGGLIQVVELLFNHEKVTSFEEISSQGFKSRSSELFSNGKTTPLQVAVCENKNDVLKFLLTKTPMDKLTNEVVFKLLSLACCTHNLNAIDIILDKKFKNNRKKITKFLSGRSATLFLDVMNYKYVLDDSLAVVPILKRLISLSNDSYKLIKDEGFNLLHIAAKSNYTHVVELLIKNKFNVNQCTDKTAGKEAGLTPLMLACEREYGLSTKTIDLLIANKANLNIESPDKETALYLAVKNGSFEMTKTLIEAKANCKVQDKLGNTLLHVSIDSKNNLGRSSQCYDIGINPDRNAARLIKFLIKNKADLHTKNFAGDSPLHYAILKEFQFAIELLVRNRADIMQLDKNGKTAIQKAESRQNTQFPKSIEITKYLAIEYEKRRAMNIEKSAVTEIKLTNNI